MSRGMEKAAVGIAYVMGVDTSHQHLVSAAGGGTFTNCTEAGAAAARVQQRKWVICSKRSSTVRCICNVFDLSLRISLLQELVRA